MIASNFAARVPERRVESSFLTASEEGTMAVAIVEDEGTSSCSIVEEKGAKMNNRRREMAGAKMDN